MVVFVQGARLGAALAEPVLQSLPGRVGDVLLEGPGARLALDDAGDGGGVEGAEAQCVLHRSDEVWGSGSTPSSRPRSAARARDDVCWREFGTSRRGWSLR